MVPGTVSLVGAGPGDPELVTVKARRLLDEADVVCHDSSVSEAVRTPSPASVEWIDVGECVGDERTPRAAVDRLLIRRATAGDDVVRLVSGDPCVSGRGGETAERLARHGVPVEIVPGVTGAVAAPGAAGIPPTHRDHASSVTVVTGHGGDGALDWGALARSVDAGGTLVLPAVDRLADDVGALRAAGLDPETPAAAVERAPRDAAFAVTGTLDTIADRVRAAEVDPPAVAVVGDVVSVRDRVSESLRAAGTTRRGTAGDESPVSTE